MTTDFDPKELEGLDTPALGEAPMSTHIDAYYKGFHVGFTIRSADNSKLPAAKSIAVIEQLIATGYKPSWNQETNKDALNLQTPAVQPVTGYSEAFSPPAPGVVDTIPTSLGNCPKCNAPMAVSKAGKIYCSKTCWLPK